MSDEKKDKGGCLTIVVEDSGKGFDYAEYVKHIKQVDTKHGRGVSLIGTLATSLKYNKEGNCAEVQYEWR